MTSLKVNPRWINSLKDPKNYLQIIQEKAQKNLLVFGYPNSKFEPWRLNNLKLLENFINLPISEHIKTDYEKKYPFINASSKNILQIKIDNLEDEISLPKGIRKLSNEEIEAYLGKAINQCKCKQSWSTVINESSTGKVLALEIKSSNNTPIELIIPSDSNKFHSARILLKIEENANLQLTQLIIGEQNSAQSLLLEMLIGEGATVEHGLIALGGGNGSLISNFAIEQKQRSDYSLTSMHEGWLFSRFEPHILQVKGKAKTTLNGLQISTDKQELSTYSSVRFQGPEGELSQLNKSSANKNSHALFNGAIQVPKIAQRTQAAQLSRNLILSKRARINTKPELEIVADDVRCTHGATVSQLQEEELFYLRSRGIRSDQAASLLLEGYYQEILRKLPLYSFRWTFLNNLLSRKTG
tara:strand:+ start:16912 stop:18150 length:1239 start_codon:yes stop_codon:yes gene_type:complete